MKHESGVHRVQRVPITEGSGRIHTSTMSVVIMPQPTEVMALALALALILCIYYIIFED